MAAGVTGRGGTRPDTGRPGVEQRKLVTILFADLVGLGKGWWFWLFLIGMALLVVLSIIKIKVTTRLQLLVGVVTVYPSGSAKTGITALPLVPCCFKNFNSWLWCW